MMPRIASPLGLILAHTLVLGAAASAQAQNTVDRRADQIAVVQKPGDPAGTYRVSVAWGIDVTTSTTLPVGSVLSVSRNGTSIWTSTLPGQAFVGGTCPSCQPGTLCICVSGGDCTCAPCTSGGTGPCTASHGATLELPGAIPLAPGDTLTFTVTPVPGSTPDQLSTNNVKTLVFDGSQTFWNRRVISATLVPSPCPAGPNLYDLVYELAYDFSGLQGAIDLGTRVELSLGGTVMFVGDACADSPWILSNVDTCEGFGCDNFCGYNSCAGTGILVDCTQFELPTGLTTCACSSGAVCYTVPGLTIPPSMDGIDMLVRVTQVAPGGATYGLKEIPLLTGDDTFSSTFKAAAPPCNADLTGDGKVDAADLAILLGAWGPCR